MRERDDVSVYHDGQGVVDVLCVQFCALRSEVEGLRSQHIAGVTTEGQLSVDMSRLSSELEQQ